MKPCVFHMKGKEFAQRLCGKPAPHEVEFDGVPGKHDYCDEHWAFIQSGEASHRAKKVN